MKLSLRTKLTITYALLAVLLVATISIVANLFIQNQFQQYVLKQQEAKSSQYLGLVSQQFDANGFAQGDVKLNALGNIGMNALEQGMILKIYDKTGKTLWDATSHNNGMCNSMLATMAQNLQRSYPGMTGGYVEKTFAISGTSGATMKIGYYGPFLLNENDIYFINSFNEMLLIMGLIALVASLLLGTIMARRISDPIRKVILVAEKISQGNFVHRIGTGSSTTELDKLNSALNNLGAALENRDTLQKRLTSDVAHELRTPLATLQSHLEAMIDGVWPADKERLVGCHEEILRITRMVGELEKLAKLEGENLKLNFSTFDLKALAQGIVRGFESDAERISKNISIEVNGDETEITADHDKLSQVLINLISNAVKFGKTNGKITVLISANEFSVADDGLGIAATDLPHVFERFFRADESRSRATGGSGIGLAIVKGIVDAHGWEITASSVEGEGSEFKVII